MHHKTMFYFHTWIHMDGEQGSDIMHISFVDIISYQGICENIICRAYSWSATVVAGRCAKISFPVRGPARRLQRLFVIIWSAMLFIRGTIWKYCRYHLPYSIYVVPLVRKPTRILFVVHAAWSTTVVGRDIVSCQSACERIAMIICHNSACDTPH